MKRMKNGIGAIVAAFAMGAFCAMLFPTELMLFVVLAALILLAVGGSICVRR